MAIGFAITRDLDQKPASCFSIPPAILWHTLPRPNIPDMRRPAARRAARRAAPPPRRPRRPVVAVSFPSQRTCTKLNDSVEFYSVDMSGILFR
ncbi:MAG: hypothetical protein QM296_06345 [Bacillota bacterium]|nr:hypothetical protein [Bacillota bacterium]